MRPATAAASALVDAEKIVAEEMSGLLQRARKRKLEIVQRDALHALESATVTDELTSWERSTVSPANQPRPSPVEESHGLDITDDDRQP